MPIVGGAQVRDPRAVAAEGRKTAAPDGVAIDRPALAEPRIDGLTHELGHRAAFRGGGLAEGGGLSSRQKDLCANH